MSLETLRLRPTYAISSGVDGGVEVVIIEPPHGLRISWTLTSLGVGVVPFAIPEPILC